MAFDILEPEAPAPVVPDFGTDADAARRILDVRHAVEGSRLNPSPQLSGFDILPEPDGNHPSTAAGFDIIDLNGEDTPQTKLAHEMGRLRNEMEPNPAGAFTKLTTGANLDEPLVHFPQVGRAQTLADAMDALRAFSGHNGIVRRANPSPFPQDERSAMERLGEMPQATPTQGERIATGALNVPSQVATSFTSPKNIALLAGTAGVGALPRVLQALISAGFMIDMGRATPELIDRVKKAQESGDEQELTEALGHLVVNTGMAGAAGVHAATGLRAAARDARGQAPAGEPATESAPAPASAPVAAAEPANLSTDALAQLQAELRGESKTSPRLRPVQEGANAPRPAVPVQTPETVVAPAATAEAPAPAASAPEVHGLPLTPEEKAGDQSARQFIGDRAKDYDGMTDFELQLMEDLGDQGARSERKSRAVRRFMASQEREKVANAGDELAAEAQAAAKPPPAPEQAESQYTIGDVAGNVTAPRLADALEAMASGKRASQVLSEWSGGRGEYDALADVLEQLRVAAEGGRNRHEFLKLAKAYERTFKQGGRPNVDEVLQQLEEDAQSNGTPVGGVPDSTGELLGRLWDHAVGKTEPVRLSNEEHAMRMHDVATSNAGRSAAQNGGAGLLVSELHPGDRFQIRGTGLRVRSVDAESGVVRLESSGEGRGHPEQFGPRPELRQESGRFYPDRGTFAPVDNGPDAGQTVGRELPRTASERAIADLRTSIESSFPGVGRALRILRRPDETAGVPVQRAERERNRAWGVFERVFRRKIVLIEAGNKEPLPFEGITLRGHPSFLFLDTRRFHTASVLGHEFLESISLENPALFNRLRAELVPLMGEFPKYKAELDRVRNSYGLRVATELDAQRELIADFVGDCLSDTGFLTKLRERNPGVFHKLANALIDFLEKVKEKLRPYGVGHWFTDVEAAQQRVMAALEEAAGPKQEDNSTSRADVLHNPQEPRFSLRRPGDEFDLEQPENVEEQRARLARESAAAGDREKLASQRMEMARRRDARLAGDIGEAGQGSLFAEKGQQELFKPPAAEGGEQPALFSLRDNLRSLGQRIAQMEEKGEEVPQELRNRYAAMVDEFTGPNAVDASMEARTPELVESDSGGSEHGAPRGPRGIFRGEERLPSGGLRDVIDSLNRWRSRAGDWLGRRHERQDAAIGKDAADNRADRAGNLAANHIRLLLNRAFETEPGQVTKKHELREYALSFAIEAGDRGNLSEMREQLLASDFAETKWGRRAVAAMRYAGTHWDTLQPVIEEYQRVTTMQREIELNRGLNSREWEGGYVHHAWKDAPRQELLTQGGADPSQPMGAGTGFTRRREWTSLAEGIAAGGIPKSLNAVELLAKRVGDGQRKLNEISWLEGLMDVNDPVSGEPIVREPRYVPRPGPGVELRRGESGDAADEPTIEAAWVRKPEPGYVATQFGDVEVDVKRGFDGILTDLTAPSWFEGGAIRGGVRKGIAFAKSATLLGDTFHLGRMALWKTVLTGTPSYHKGLTLLDYTEADIREMTARGELPAAWTQDLIENKRKVDLALRSGLNVGGIVDNFHTEWVSHIPGLGRFNHFLFREYQRGAVVEAWLLEFNRMRRALPGESERAIASRVTRDLNLRFGSLGRQGVMKSRTMQDLARLVFLAPQWNEGLIRAEVGAAGQLLRAPVESVQRRRLVAGTLLKGTGTMILGTFVANQILNWATRGKPTWENEEEGWDKKVSAYIPDTIGNSAGFFLNPLALPAEYTHLINERLHQSKDTADAAWRLANSRLSGPARAILTLATRRDSLGRSLKPGDVTGEIAKGLVPVPIGVGAVGPAVKQVVTGQPSEKYPGQFERQSAATFGVKLDRAPTSEQRIRALAHEFNVEKGIVPSAEYYAGDFDEFTKALRIGNMNDAREYLEDLLKKKTARQVYEHFRRWSAAPFTGQRARESEFLRTLTPEQHTAWEQARAARAAMAKQAAEMVRENAGAGATR